MINQLLDSEIESKVVEYSQILIQKKSITPIDAGCQEWVAKKLEKIGFEIKELEINGVKNMIAAIGEGAKTIAFVGHTDVVPSGPEKLWITPPFEGNIVGEELVGRGASDMKSAIAAILSAIENFIANGGIFNSKFLMLITSDEEGEAEYGSKEIKQYLDKIGIKIDYCLVGEPSSDLISGDTIKIGRRGSVSGKIEFYGKQGHTAYLDHKDNAINKMQKVLNAISSIEFDPINIQGPKTTIQYTNVDSGNFVDNVVPTKCHVHFNIRFSNAHTIETLKELIVQSIESVTADYFFELDRHCDPYINEKTGVGSFVELMELVVRFNLNRSPKISMSGGTSDGRFFSNCHTEVIEIGVPNATIHSINERVKISDLIMLEKIYYSLFQCLFFAENEDEDEKENKKITIIDKAVLSVSD